MITETKTIDKIEIMDMQKLQVREATIIEKDGIVIAKNFHRYVLSPGDDLTNQPQKIKDIAEVLWK
jgi:hypothetical protein